MSTIAMSTNRNQNIMKNCELASKTNLLFNSKLIRYKTLAGIEHCWTYYHDDELCCFTPIAFHTQKMIAADLHEMITPMNDAKDWNTSLVISFQICYLNYLQIYLDNYAILFVVNEICIFYHIYIAARP